MQKKKTKAQQNTYNDTLVDISDISDELTDRARRFVFWFCFPGSDTFQNKKRAAVAAGYAPRNASVSGYKLFKNKIALREIERISKKQNSETIDTLYRKFINSLETRAFFDPADFIEGKKFKDISDIVPDKRVCLDQPIIDMKDGGIVGYQFGSRRAAMTEIKEIHEKMNPGNDDEASVEETLRIMAEAGRTEIIAERRRVKDEISKIAGFVPDNEGLIQEL